VSSSSPGPFGPLLPVDDADELAGVVDLFGALSAAELTAALVELAYRQDGTAEGGQVEDAAADAVDWAVERYYLVAYTPDAEAGDETVQTGDDGVEDRGRDGDERGDTELLTVGPVAFPTLPDEAEDLPHILDIERRAVSRASLARAVETRLRGDAARAVAAEDEPRIQHLFDVTYDLEAWTPVDVGEVRERLEAALADSREREETE
jgi:hypothetical protein